MSHWESTCRIAWKVKGIFCSLHVRILLICSGTTKIINIMVEVTHACRVRWVTWKARSSTYRWFFGNSSLLFDHFALNCQTFQVATLFDATTWVRNVRCCNTIRGIWRLFTLSCCTFGRFSVCWYGFSNAIFGPFLIKFWLNLRLYNLHDCLNFTLQNVNVLFKSFISWFVSLINLYLSSQNSIFFLLSLKSVTYFEHLLPHEFNLFKERLFAYIHLI